jgi:hypothetical protein
LTVGGRFASIDPDLVGDRAMRHRRFHPLPGPTSPDGSVLIADGVGDDVPQTRTRPVEIDQP